MFESNFNLQYFVYVGMIYSTNRYINITGMKVIESLNLDEDDEE